jgi:c-di-GMP-binding flagellar brake protein YcgR
VESDLLVQLRKYEGKIVRLTSTEGEIMIAKIADISEEEHDVTLDILSTNQPERYAHMGKNYQDGAWAIPFEFIAAVGPGEDRAGRPE